MILDQYVQDVQAYIFTVRMIGIYFFIYVYIYRILATPKESDMFAGQWSLQTAKITHKGLRPMREPNFSLQFQYPSDVVQDQVFISGTRRSPSLRHALFRFFRGYDIWSSWNMKVFHSFGVSGQPWYQPTPMRLSYDDSGGGYQCGG